jgi:hypothetical protein
MTKAKLWLSGIALATTAGSLGLWTTTRLSMQQCPFRKSATRATPLDGLEDERAQRGWDREVRVATAPEALARFNELDAELQSEFGNSEQHQGEASVEWIARPARQVETRYPRADRELVLTLTNLGGTFLIHRQVRSLNATQKLAQKAER